MTRLWIPEELLPERPETVRPKCPATVTDADAVNYSPPVIPVFIDDETSPVRDSIQLRPNDINICMFSILKKLDFTSSFTMMVSYPLFSANDVEDNSSIEPIPVETEAALPNSAKRCISPSDDSGVDSASSSSKAAKKSRSDLCDTSPCNCKYVCTNVFITDVVAICSSRFSKFVADLCPVLRTYVFVYINISQCCSTFCIGILAFLVDPVMEERSDAASAGIHENIDVPNNVNATEIRKESLVSVERETTDSPVSSPVAPVVMFEVEASEKLERCKKLHDFHVFKCVTGNDSETA